MKSLGGSVEQKKSETLRSFLSPQVNAHIPDAEKKGGESRVLQVGVREVTPASLLDPLAAGVTEVRDSTRLARLLAEKCEIGEAIEIQERATLRARVLGDPSLLLETLAQTLRLRADAGHLARVEELESEILSVRQALEAAQLSLPPLYWYCLGAVERVRDRPVRAMRAFHRFLKELKQLPAEACLGQESRSLWLGRAWVMLATVFNRQGKVQRGAWIAERLRNEQLLRAPEHRDRGILGTAALLLALQCERQGDWTRASSLLREAQTEFLRERNWYAHLSVLYGFARLARLNRQFHQAEMWILQIESVVKSAPEMSLLRREMERERERLNDQEVDLKVDARKCLVWTKEGKEVSLGKQYLLLHLLRKLWEAHKRPGEDADRGLSKREIIEQVWGERYRPEVHDNKLYYNINRLRKLIEPDTKAPKYLESWREGYRLGPGLKVEYLEVPEERVTETVG